jgi:para-aminobenzoate synthetase component 1/para-aminobenzoate synthetase/4-amino-4-deoxychorismate lyase
MVRENPFVLLEDRLGGRVRYFGSPVEVVTAETAADVPRVLDRLQALHEAGKELAGYFAYELGYVLEPKLAPLLPAEHRVPLIRFAAFDRVETRDIPPAESQPRVRRLDPGWSREEYIARFRRVIEYINAGDVYQINLTFPLHGVLEGDPVALYAALRARQPVAHGGLVALGDETIVSLSPELFFELDGASIRSRPMKGTARRGFLPLEDMMIARDLKEDDKQRAENLMIVDLLRNDIGRLSKIGSVRVPDLFTVETYPTLHQMTSTVEGKLSGDLSIREILVGLFPCGSVTGAPKIRAMEIIRELETSPRGVYCGAIGRVSADGSMHFNVAIRTLTVFPDGRFVQNVGSGLVADSRADAEYDECLLKARFLSGFLS